MTVEATYDDRILLIIGLASASPLGILDVNIFYWL